MNPFAKAKNIILDAVFPHQCVCGKWDKLVCDNCFESIPKNKTQLCPICKKLSENGQICSSCRHKGFLTGVMIFGDHEGVLKSLIWRYKYNLVKDLSFPLSELLADRFGGFIQKKKFIITYVPMSRQRHNWRGFNQSELLAEKTSKELNVEMENYLFRIGKHKSQVGLRRKERIKNLEGKFVINSKAPKVSGKRILIVDDVYTTGTTLEECAKVLRKNGAREVWGLVLSRD